MVKPVSKSDWTIDNPDFATVTVEPTATKKKAGWFPDERPPSETWNWVFWNHGEWIKYFEEVTDGLILQLGQYDAVIGTGGTHADINTLMTDIATPASGFEDARNVLIVSNISIAAIQVVDVEGMNFTFKPSASFVKDTVAIGLQIDAKRVRILNGRFQNYDTGGDKAIELTANAKNCIVTGCYFNNNDTAIDDLGDNNTISGNIEEVA